MLNQQLNRKYVEETLRLELEVFQAIARAINSGAGRKAIMDELEVSRSQYDKVRKSLESGAHLLGANVKIVEEEDTEHEETNDDTPEETTETSKPEEQDEEESKEQGDDETEEPQDDNETPEEENEEEQHEEQGEDVVENPEKALKENGVTIVEEGDDDEFDDDEFDDDDIAFSLAARRWERRTSDKKLSELFDVSVEDIERITGTDEYVDKCRALFDDDKMTAEDRNKVKNYIRMAVYGRNKCVVEALSVKLQIKQDVAYECLKPTMDKFSEKNPEVVYPYKEHTIPIPFGKREDAK